MGGSRRFRFIQGSIVSAKAQSAAIRLLRDPVPPTAAGAPKRRISPMRAAAASSTRKRVVSYSHSPSPSKRRKNSKAEAPWASKRVSLDGPSPTWLAPSVDRRTPSGSRPPRPALRRSRPASGSAQLRLERVSVDPQLPCRESSRLQIKAILQAPEAIGSRSEHSPSLLRLLPDLGAIGLRYQEPPRTSRQASQECHGSAFTPN